MPYSVPSTSNYVVGVAVRAARVAYRCFRAGCVAYVLTIWTAFLYAWGLPALKVRHENRRA